MTLPKSKFNACPVCGLPRGKGPHEFSHGKCMEQRAKTEGKKAAFPDHPTESLRTLRVKDVETRKRSNTAAKYKSGKLPKFMYD